MDIQYFRPELLFGGADSPVLRTPLVPWKPTSSLNSNIKHHNLHNLQKVFFCDSQYNFELEVASWGDFSPD